MSKKARRGPFESFTEIMGWLQIVASPLLLGIVIGYLIYVADPSSTRLFIGILIAALGLIIGIMWATRVWKNDGTSNYISKIAASPELDKKDD